MKLFSFGSDGGESSGVTGFWLIEIKSLFSIVFLRFSQGTREAYHSHAFNALTWFLWGAVEEQHRRDAPVIWTPSLLPKYTPRATFHRVNALRTTYALSLRGPWSRTWKEYDAATDTETTLTHGRLKVL